MNITDEVLSAIERFAFDEDYKQELYLKLLEKDMELPEFESDAHLRAFIMAYYNGVRSNESKKELNRIRLMLDNAGALTPADRAGSPEDMMIAEEEWDTRWREVSDIIKNTLIDYYLLGKDMSEIGKYESVKKRLQRGRAILEGDDNG